MRAAAVLLAFAFTASVSAQPRIVGRVSQDDTRAIIAAIRAVTQDHIVFIRATHSVDRVGVQTESSASAGCHYLVERTGATWKVAAKSCWTRTRPSPDDASKRWPPVAWPSELTEFDFTEIKAALANYTHDEIRTIKVSGTSPLSVQVHTASPHVVTEGDFTLEKIGNEWRLTDRHQIIH